MSTTIDFLTVTNSIAALSVSGVSVKDADEIADSIGLGTAILAPRPDDFITGLTITPAELTKQNLDVSYTLHYQYYHCKIAGGLGGMFGVYAAMLAKLALIIKAFANDATLSGAIDNGAPQIGKIGPVVDAAGNTYHGCEISMTVKQFLEV